jgi:hypothetical protein
LWARPAARCRQRFDLLGGFHLRQHHRERDLGGNRGQIGIQQGGVGIDAQQHRRATPGQAAAAWLLRRGVPVA